MSSKAPASDQSDGPSPKQLDRLKAALRATEIAQKASRLAPTRPAETYGKIRDERCDNNHLVSTPQ